MSATSPHSSSDEALTPEEFGRSDAVMNGVWGALYYKTEATILLKKTHVSIGRASDNDIVIRDRRISAKHCQITHTITTPQQPSLAMDGSGQHSSNSSDAAAEASGRLLSQVEIEDFSRNGTYVNGHPLVPGTKFTLGTGDVITVLWELGAHESEAILYRFENLSGLEEVSPLHHLTHHRYTMVKELGRGGFAKVYMALPCGADGQPVAIKVIDKDSFYTSGIDVSVLCREAELMKDLQHPNIVRTYETFDTPRNLAIVLEYLGGGDLFDCVSKVGPLPELKARQIFAQMLAALSYLHGRGIVHRDIKPENVLLVSHYEPNKDTQIKLADFGLAKPAGPTGQLSTACGTYIYLSPEALQNYAARASGETPPGYGTAVDMWAAGVLLYFVLSAVLPFVDRPGDKASPTIEEQIRTARFGFQAEIWSRSSPACKTIIQSLLQPFPEARLTADQALRHHWFTIDLSTPRFEAASSVAARPRIPPGAVLLADGAAPYRQKTARGPVTRPEAASDTESDCSRVKKARNR